MAGKTDWKTIELKGGGSITYNAAFDNEERHRYYGIRVGDIVKSYGDKEVEVIAYHLGDNNGIQVRDAEGNEYKEIPEWCTIITKVEDRIL